MEQEKFDLKKVKVCRTPEGTIFETTALVILLIAWIVSIASPSHINLFNIPLRNIRQVELSIRMVRILSVGLALMSLTVAIVGPNSPLTKVLCIGIVAVVGVIGFVFIYLIQKTE